MLKKFINYFSLLIVLFLSVSSHGQAHNLNEGLTREAVAKRIQKIYPEGLPFDMDDSVDLFFRLQGKQSLKENHVALLRPWASFCFERADYENAIVLGNLAKEYNDPHAQELLADIYLAAGELLFVQHQYERALNMFMRAANEDSCEAFVNIAEHYRLGLGVEKNIKAAKHFLEEALNGPLYPYYYEKAKKDLSDILFSESQVLLN